MRQRRGLVGALRGAHEQLWWDRAITHVQEQRLVRAQAPRILETALEVLRCERPERRIPGGGFTGRIARAGRDVPALHDLVQEAVARESLPVDPRQVARAYGHTALTLQRLQPLERSGQVFRGGGHGFSEAGTYLSSRGFRVYQNLGYCAFRSLGYYVYPFQGYCANVSSS